MKFSRCHTMCDISTDYVQIWESSWLLSSQTSRGYVNMEQCHSSLNFSFALKNILIFIKIMLFMLIYNRFLELTRPFRTNTQKRCLFYYRGLECKSRKSRNTWGNRQIWPWNMEWSRAKTNRVLPRECTGHSKHPLLTTQDSTHGLHQMVNTNIRLIIFFVAKDGVALYSQQKQDQELTVAQMMNSSLPNSDLNWRK